MLDVAVFGQSVDDDNIPASNVFYKCVPEFDSTTECQILWLCRLVCL